MFDAQTVIAESGSNVELYSPWFPRQGDNATFTLEVAAIGGAGNTTITVQTMMKNSEDTGDGSAVGSTFARTSTGREPEEVTGLKELVRFKYTISSSSGSGWVTFRMLPPVWFDSVKA